MTINTFPQFLFKLLVSAGLVATLAACGGGVDSAGSPVPGLSSASSSSSPVVSSSSVISSSASSSSRYIICDSSRPTIFDISSSSSSSSSSRVANPAHHLLGGAIQGIGLNLENRVSTFAGSANADGVGSAARFNHPQSVTSDGTYLYVADMGNRSIRKIAIATGEVGTLEGGDSFSAPYALTSDGTNLYVVDIGADGIRKVVIATGEVSLFAGGQSGNADGLGVAASFNDPESITTDGTYLYVADTGNSSIRKIAIATGAVSTLAGFVRTDGMDLATSFNHPTGVATDGVNLYVADTGNNLVRKVVIATNQVSTLAGGGYGNKDGVGTEALFNGPRGIAVSGANLYVMDSLNHGIRKIVIATRAVTSLPGSVEGLDSTYSRGIAAVGEYIYVPDASNNLIRKVAITTGVVSDLAGKAAGEDAIGQAATFGEPSAATTDGTHLYVAESAGAIRKIYLATGAVTSLAKNPHVLKGVTTDGTYLYATDTWAHCIRKISIATGETSVLAGREKAGGNSDGVGADATFADPYGITTDGTNLYVSDVENNNIRKIVIATGAVSTLAGLTGDYYHSDEHVDGVGAAARFAHPFGIATDGTNLFVTDMLKPSIRKIVIATGEVTTFAGTYGSGSVDGIGVAATFREPLSITSDGTHLYVTDAGNNNIRKIVIATGEVTTMAGGSNGNLDGVGAVAKFNQPTGITTDGYSLFVTDSGNNTIRKID